MCLNLPELVQSYMQVTRLREQSLHSRPLSKHCYEISKPVTVTSVKLLWYECIKRLKL